MPPLELAPNDDSTAAEPVRFIILSGPRTGSTMLVTTLNSSPQITYFGELFKFMEDTVGFGLGGIDIPGYDNHSVADLELRNSDFKAFLNQRIFVEMKGVIATGFKQHYSHFLGFPGLREWLVEQRDMRVLHLHRRNLLRVLLSTEITKATGGWVDRAQPTLKDKHLPSLLQRALRHPARYAARIPELFHNRAPEWKAKREAITLSPQECAAFFKETELHVEFYDKLLAKHQVHTLFYEDLVDRREATLNAVQQFLGTTPRRLGVSTARQNPEPLAELIANYDELRTAFQGTEYESFLD